MADNPATFKEVAELSGGGGVVEPDGEGVAVLGGVGELEGEGGVAPAVGVDVVDGAGAEAGGGGVTGDPGADPEAAETLTASFWPRVQWLLKVQMK